MDAEHVTGLVAHAGASHALRGSRQSRTNPTLRVALTTSTVDWLVEGVRPGAIEPLDPDDKDHLDVYVLKDVFLAQRSTFPRPTVGPSGSVLSPTFAWGTEGAGKPRIQPGTTLVRFQVTSALMAVGTPDQFRATTHGDVFLNLEFERLPYPHPTGGPLMQVHFGISALWTTKADARIKHSFARIQMTHQQYADVFDAMMGI